METLPIAAQDEVRTKQPYVPPELGSHSRKAITQATSLQEIESKHDANETPRSKRSRAHAGG
jgi:hypothetical protein